MDCLSQSFWAVGMLCFLLAILGFPLDFSLFVIVYGVNTLCVDVNMFSQKLGSQVKSWGFPFVRFLQWKFYFFQLNVFPFLLFSLFQSFSLSLNPFSFFMVFFFIAPDSFPKLSDFFYGRRLFDLDGLFPHLAVKYFRISLKYFILPVEFCPFFKSSSYLLLDLYFLFYFFCYPCYIIFIL